MTLSNACAVIILILSIYIYYRFNKYCINTNSIEPYFLIRRRKAWKCPHYSNNMLNKIVF